MTLLTAPPEPSASSPSDGERSDLASVPPPGRAPRRHPLLWTLVAMGALVLLAIPLGLSAHDRVSPTVPAIGVGSQEPQGRSSGPSPSPGTGDTGAAEGGAPTAPRNPAQSTPATPQEPVIGPRLARSAWLGLKVTNLTAAATAVRTITDQADGQVLSEDVVTTQGPGGEAGLGGGTAIGGGAAVGDVEPGFRPGAPVSVNEGRLVLRVPTNSLDRVLVDLSAIGTMSYRSSRTEDVTDSYVDTQARIETMEQAVRQARALLAKATDLGQVIDLENEVTRRQADLDSLRARLAGLEQRTTTADVTVTLWTSATQPPNTTSSGFLDGLHDAWTGFLTSVGVIVTGLAVLLPWLLVGLVAAVPVRAWLRRRRATSTASAAATPAGTD